MALFLKEGCDYQARMRSTARAVFVACVATGCGSTPHARAIDVDTSATPVVSASAPPSASAPTLPTDVASDDPRAPRFGWPLPEDCTSPQRCKMPNGELGVTCENVGPCLDPCPSGHAPNNEATFCEKPCKADHDCPGGTCSEEGLCDSFPVFSCSHVRDCALDDGHVGAQCKKSDPCVNPCKTGLFQNKAGDCAKPCASNADCPKGTCDAGFCGPTCPGKGCPYPWD